MSTFTRLICVSMLDIVISYQNLLQNVESYISKSDFKKEFFIKELGVSRATFYNKIKNKSFSVDEMLKLSGLLFPEELKAFEIKQALSRSRLDSDNGNVVPHEQVMANARKKIG